MTKVDYETVVKYGRPIFCSRFIDSCDTLQYL